MAETETEFTPMDISMAQQLDGLIKRTKALDKYVYENGAVTLNVDGYPIVVNRHLVDVLKRITFTARYQYFVDTEHPDIARDIWLSNMESSR